MLVIVHSGQTGVERGAHRGAKAAGFAQAGFMPKGARDELGLVPDDVAQHLTPCSERGPRVAVRANVAIASGVVIVVPDHELVAKYTAMNAVLGAIRAAKIPSLVVDPLTDLKEAAKWVGSLTETSGSTRVLVTGPRGTRWTDGERVAMRVVASFA
jgi:hypothetical protein